MTDRGLAHNPRPFDVVFYRLARVELHQRDVLVGGGVENHVGSMLPQDVCDAAFVGGVGDHRIEVDVALKGGQRALDRPQGVLVALEKDEGARLQRQHLLAQLGSNGPACSRDEDPPPLDQLLRRLHVEAYRGPTEQILHSQVLHLAQCHAAVEDVPQPRNGLDRQLVRLELFDDRAEDVRCRPRHRHQHLVGIRLPDDPREVPPGPEHGDAVDAASDLGWIVVDESDGEPFSVAAVQHLPEDHLPGVARSVDQHAACPGARSPLPP